MSENEETDEAEEKLEAAFRAAVARGDFNGHCALCGSTDLRFEAALTRFATMAEAQPELRRLEEENAKSRRLMFVSGMAYDAQKAQGN